MDQNSEDTYRVPLLDYLGSGYAIFLLVAAILIVASSVFLWRASLDRSKFIDRIVIHLMIGLSLWAIALAVVKFWVMAYYDMLRLIGGQDDFHLMKSHQAVVAAMEMLAHSLLFLTASLAAFISIVAQRRRRRASITEPK